MSLVTKRELARTGRALFFLRLPLLLLLHDSEQGVVRRDVLERSAGGLGDGRRTLCWTMKVEDEGWKKRKRRVYV
jgi:hypothetical protein